MPKAVFMKAGESIKEVKRVGKLYRNVIKMDKMEANVTHMPPGTKSQPFKHKGQEIHIMIKGEVEFHVGGEKFIMQEGDMLYHHSEVPHHAANHGCYESVYVTISTPPSFPVFEK